MGFKIRGRDSGFLHGEEETVGSALLRRQRRRKVFSTFKIKLYSPEEPLMLLSPSPSLPQNKFAQEPKL